jgi:hypothetical protein
MGSPIVPNPMNPIFNVLTSYTFGRPGAARPVVHLPADDLTPLEQISGEEIFRAGSIRHKRATSA